MSNYHKYYTTKEAGRVLELSKNNGDAIVRSYIEAGYLEAKKMGKEWLVLGSSLKNRRDDQLKIWSRGGKPKLIY